MLESGPGPEDLTSLLQEAAASLPARGIGIVQRAGAEHVLMTYADAFGVAAYRYRYDDVPDAVRPSSQGPRRVTAAELLAGPGGPFEARVLLAGQPDHVRQAHAIGQVVCLPLPGVDPQALLVAGLAESDAPGPATLLALRDVAARSAALLVRPETLEQELDRLRRLDAVDELLSELFQVLDIRWVFDRVSALTSHVLPHDVLGLYSEDLAQLTVYAHTGEEDLPDIGETRYPVQLVEPWLYHVVADLRAHPYERELPLTRAGGRSSLRVPLRLEERLLGALNFTSFEPAKYADGDVAVAQRIGDHVALALSHHRLAEEGRGAEELRARNANSELLDELLASLTDTGELRDVFDRVSAIAKRVLPHDALALPVLLPDGRHVRVYASAGFSLGEAVPVPERALAEATREHVLVDDMQADPLERELPPAQQGFRSMLRLFIRMDGQLAAALEFLARAPSAYKASDVAVGRRVADRLALSLSRERRLEASQRADEALARAARLEARVAALTEELSQRAGSRRVIGDAPSWRQVLRQATQVAATESTVLLLGESGTGKEVVARFVHGGSARREGPFVALNCAALPEQLLEAELFGYERGAFTGAVQSKPGQLEQASGGTLFLDEVGEMSLAAQAKFLRVLQEREFQRLGGTRVLKAEVRVVAATNRDLLKAMERGQFREDLYYRLNVFSIQLPPLRERKDDVLRLSEVFLEELSRMLGRPPGGISKEARQALLEYDWPGNVRELRNVLERAAILADGGLIAAEHLALRPPRTESAVPRQLAASEPLPPAADGWASSVPTAEHPEPAVDDRLASPRGRKPSAADIPSTTGDLQAVEKALIEKALRETRFNKSGAAKRLGITRAQLYVRLRRHGLE